MAIAVQVYHSFATDAIAALSIVGLESDFEQKQDFYLAKLKKAAQQITQNIITQLSQSKNDI